MIRPVTSSCPKLDAEEYALAAEKAVAGVEMRVVMKGVCAACWKAGRCTRRTVWVAHRADRRIAVRNIVKGLSGEMWSENVSGVREILAFGGELDAGLQTLEMMSKVVSRLRSPEIRVRCEDSHTLQHHHASL